MFYKISRSAIRQKDSLCEEKNLDLDIHLIFLCELCRVFLKIFIGLRITSDVSAEVRAKNLRQ